MRLLLGAALILSVCQGEAADFRPLKGAEIKIRFAGRALTDGVHWRYTFRRDGSLPSIALGRERIGAWRVEGDQLCMVQGVGGAECYAVWQAGTAIQLRPDNEAIPTEEGRLEPAGIRR
jgi:hypothetical protein